MAAAGDHQMRAAMTGSPMSNQPPTARVSIPLALRSANQSAGPITTTASHGQASRATLVPTRQLDSGPDAPARSAAVRAASGEARHGAWG
jgi:hypothetical protein